MAKRSKRIIAIILSVLMVFQFNFNTAVFAESNGSTEHPMDSYITAATIQAQVGSKWYDVTDPDCPDVPKDAAVRVGISYNPSDVVFSVGDTIVYDLPEGIIVNSVQTGEVVDGSTVVGDYVITKDGTITINITNEAYLKASSGKLKNGTINFRGSFNKGFWGKGGEKEITFGDCTIKVPFEEDAEVTKAVLTIDKTATKDGAPNYSISYSDKDNAYIIYTITVSAPKDNTQDMKNVVVEDTFSGSTSSYLEVVDYDTKGVGTFSNMKWTIGDMAPGTTHVMELKVKVKPDFFKAGSTGTRSIVNVATVKADGMKPVSDSSTINRTSSVSIVKKNSGYEYDKTTGKGYVTYTVTAKTGNNYWPMKNVEVRDIFGTTNAKFVLDYVEINAPEGTTTTTVNEGSNKRVTWKIGDMEPNTTKTLTYRVEIDDDIFVSGTDSHIGRTLQNTAYLDINGTNKAKESSKVSFIKEWINKNGTVVTDEDDPHYGQVKFVVYANSIWKGYTTTNSSGDTTVTNPASPLDYIKVYDKLSGNWAYVGDVSVNCYERGYVKADGTPSKTNLIKSYTFTPDVQDDNSWIADLEGNYFYELVYYAEYTGNGIGTPSIGNTAGVGIGVGGDDYYHEASWEGTGKDYNGLIKSPDGSVKGDIASWKSEITNSIPAGTVYYDWRDTSKNDFSFTDEQIAAIEIGGAGANADVTVSRLNENGKVGFKIVFNEAVNASEENPITIKYKSTLETSDLKPADTGVYVNKASLVLPSGETDDAQAECTYLKDQKFNKEAGTYDENTGLMTWKLHVNVTGSMQGDAQISDQLPDGLKYVNAEITARGSKASATSIEATALGQNVSINVKDLVASGDKNAFVTITLTTKVVDKNFLVGNASKTFVNEAELSFGGEKYDSAAQQTITNTALTKAGKYDENTAPNIEYTITVNPNGLDMLENASTITIEDTMGTGLMLKSDTLKIKNTKTGDTVPVTNLNISQNEQKQTVFTFDVPDNAPLTITYKAYVSGEVGTTVNAVNTVTYSGFSEVPPVVDTNEITVSESNATIEGAVGFYLLKKDPVAAAVLEGAEYTLYEVDPADPENLTFVQTAESDSLGNVSFFGKDGLDLDKVYAFKETKAPEGYYIDAENKELTYVAFKESSVTGSLANLDVKVIQKGVALERYNYKGEITVDKSFTGKAAEGKYYFGLFDANNKLVTINGSKAITSISVTEGKVTGNAVFKGVPFGEYTVYETDENGSRLSADNDGAATINGTKYLVSGEGEVSVSYNDPKETIGIVNTHNDTASVQFEADKTLSGANYDMRAGQFSFQLKGDGIEDTVVENDADGNIIFPEITYKVSDLNGADEKVYNYTISEVAPADKEGITYSEDVYDITVTVTHEDGELSVDKEITLNDKAVESINFTNTYDASGKVQFEGTKALEDANFDLVKGQFEFNIKGPKLENGVTVTNDADGNIMFPEITYELADLDGKKSAEFEYTVTEVNGGKTIDGVTYDDTEYKVTVTVTDNEDGTLKVETSDNADNLDFTNTYDASGEYTFAGQKNLKDANFSLNADDYSFVITGDTLNGEVTVGHDADGNIDFPTFEYKLEDLNGKESATFNYTVKEVNGGETISGVTYDNTVYEVEVTVTDNGDGTLGVTSTGSDDAKALDFTNTYDAEGSITFEGNKALDGANFELKEDAYSFVIEGDTLDKAITVGHNADGSIKFPEFTYEMADLDGEESASFEYTVKEVKGSQAGITYSDKEYTVTVTVEDAKDGTLNTSYTVNDGNGPANIISFVNTYNAEGTTTISGTKALEGAALTAGAYEFELTETTAGVNEPYTATDKNDASGNFSFELPKFTPADAGKTFTYEVKEKAGNVQGVDYDETVYNVAVTVIDNNDGTLKFETVITDGNETVDTIKFTNDFSGSVELTKNDGNGKLLDGAVFALYKDGKIFKENLTIKDGKISVEDLDEGSYYFVETTPPAGYASELDQNGEAVQYPFVIGTDAEKAVVDATVTVSNDDTEFEFAKVDAGDNSKLIGGAELKLTDSEGDVVDEWTSSAEETHKITGKLVVGETYTLTEVKAPAGYAVAESIEFTVENTGEPVTIAMEDEQTLISITKVDIADSSELAGAELEVYDSEGKLIDSWTSTEEAHVIKGELVVGETYTIKEKLAPTGFGYITSDIEFTVNADGTVTTNNTVTTDENGNSVILVEDASIKLSVDKVDFVTNESIEGAEFALYGEDSDEPIVTWVSDGQPFNFGEYLTAPSEEDQVKTYVLKETTVPEGYFGVEDIEFTVAFDGTLTVVSQDEDVVYENGTMTVANRPEGSIQVEKNVIVDGDPFNSKATYYVTLFEDENLTTVAAGGETKAIYMDGQSVGTVVFEKMITGKTYYVAETDKDGNVLESGDFGTTEIVIENGNVAIETPDVIPVVKITNSYDTEDYFYQGSLSVKKEVLLKDKPFNSKATYYVTLFEDENLTTVAAGGETKAIYMNDGSTAEVVYENLAIGETYYVAETDQDGNVLESGDYGTTEIIIDNPEITFGEVFEQSVSITNCYDLEDYFYQGSLSVTKEVLVSGEEFDSDVTFYVTLFEDENFTTVAEGGETKAINMDGDSSADVIFDNLEIGETYYVAETDENGNVLEDGDFGTSEIIIDGQEVIFGDELSQEVMITNCYESEDYFYEFFYDEEPKTGDDFAIGKTIALMMAAIAAMAGVTVSSRRKFQK